jgi:hypothetical protein
MNAFLAISAKNDDQNYKIARKICKSSIFRNSPQKMQFSANK